MAEQDALKTNELLLAILAILVDEREARARESPELRKTEELLADAGLDHRAIAPMIGKSPDAVRMAISRAKKSKSKKGGKSG